MYNTLDILSTTILLLIFVYNVFPTQMIQLINDFKIKNPHLYNKFIFLIDLYNFISEHNPLLLDYDYNNLNNKYDNDAINNENKKEENKNQVQINFEDKYLEKFKTFSNDFIFNESELEEQVKEYETIKKDYENKRLQIFDLNQKNLFRINEIQEKGVVRDEKNETLFSINDFGINKILEYYGIDELYADEPDDVNLDELYLDLLKDKEIILKNLEDLEKNAITEDDLRSKARDLIINKKLDTFINNYIIEHTPLGNIVMRYNNDKKSFEYFSNNTIPYRYLEPVGRRYVMTYWCKQIFVDIEEELKKAEVQYNLKKDDEKRRQEEIKNNPRDVIAKLKSYNKETKNQVTMNQPMKNRSSNNVLPPQIKANLPNVNNNSEKQLLKEHANRYTWEGRLTSFCPLKKIDKKALDKKLTMSYADFKRIQQEQNKK